MDGKSLILFLSIILIAFTKSHGQVSQRKAYLRSGLLFEKHHSEPILVNPTQLTFYRSLNLTLLLQTNELLQHYTKSYLSFCDYIRGTSKFTADNGEPEFFRLPLKSTLNDAPMACLKERGKLPEIKTAKEKTDLQLYLARFGIENFPAGIIYDSLEKAYLYMSNKDIVQFSQNTFSQIGFEQNKTNVLLSIQEERTHERARTHKFVYQFPKNRQARLQMYGANSYNSYFDIICQKLNIDQNQAIETNVLMKMISHTCLRDYRGLNATTTLLKTELNNFLGNQKGRNIRQSYNPKKQTIECYTHICTQLSTTIKLIDTHTDYFTIFNYPIKHLKLYTIFSTLKNNNFTAIDNFKQYVELLVQPELANRKISKDPQAELIHLYANDFFHKNYEPGFMLPVSFFQNNQSNFLNTINDWTMANNSNEFFQATFEAKHRTKRFAPLAIGGGIMLANTISSASTGEAPLSWFGNVLSSTLGLASRSDINKVVSHLQQHGHALSDLSINQEQLFESYLQVRRNVAALQDVASQLEYGVANMAIELDNKLAIKHLQFIMQITLLKIADAFSNANIHNPSPYIFSQEELDQISSKYAKNKIFLSSNMKDVHVSVLRNYTQILFTFTIPVMDDRSLFNFYEVKRVPIFEKGKSYFARADLRYFAITSNTNEYSALSESEYFICLTNKQCQISDVIHPINPDSACTVQTFQENALKCDLIQTEHYQKPFFAFYNNKTFFSVPEPLNIRITCQESAMTYVTETQTKQISGTGYIEIKPSCSIVLPDNRKYFSNPILEAEHLDTSNMMNILEESHPTILNFTFQIPTPTPATTKATPTLRPISIPFIEQIYQEISTPAKALSTTLIFIIIFFVFIFIGIFLCMTSKCFRDWFGSCTLMKNPKTWWTQYKNYDLHNFDKITSSKYFKRHMSRYTPGSCQAPRTSTPVLPDPEIIQEYPADAPSYVSYNESNIYPQFVYPQGVQQYPIETQPKSTSQITNASKNPDQ